MLDIRRARRMSDMVALLKKHLRYVCTPSICLKPAWRVCLISSVHITFGCLPACNWNLSLILMQRNGVDMNTGDYDQRTALHLAASNGHLEACSWLISQAQVDINPVDRLEGTPYSDAIRHKHKVVAMLLEEKGALPSGHPSLETRRGQVDEIRAAERKKAEKDRMVTIIEKSKETLILNVATDLLGQLDILVRARCTQMVGFGLCACAVLRLSIYKEFSLLSHTFTLLLVSNIQTSFMDMLPRKDTGMFDFK